MKTQIWGLCGPTAPSGLMIPEIHGHRRDDPRHRITSARYQRLYVDGNLKGNEFRDWGWGSEFNAAIEYKAGRQNGTEEDAPEIPFPNDGVYTCSVTDNQRVRYTEGIGDKDYMDKRDESYVFRLECEGRLDTVEPNLQREAPALYAKIMAIRDKEHNGTFLVGRFARYEPGRINPYNVTSSSTAIILPPINPTLPNWCAIYVWHSVKRNGEYCSSKEALHGSVGHAAMQTNLHYMSFWPARRPPGNVAGVLGTHSTFHNNYGEDLAEEGREADAKVVFYTLDTERINNAFAAFKASPVSKRWTLFGRNIFNTIFFIFNKGRGQSCSGLVYHLLKMGNILKFHYKKEFEREQLYVTPNSIFRMISDAKQSELVIYPITRTYVTPFISKIKGINLDLISAPEPSPPPQPTPELPSQIGISISLEAWSRASLQAYQDGFFSPRGENVNLLAYEIAPQLIQQVFRSEAIFPDLGWQTSKPYEQTTFMLQQPILTKQFLKMFNFYQIDEESVAAGAAVLETLAHRTVEDVAGNEFVIRFFNKFQSWLLEHEPMHEKTAREEKERKIELEERREAERLSSVSLELFNLCRKTTHHGTAELAMIDNLIKSGADLSIKDDDARSCGWNALHWAVYLGHENIISKITAYLQTLPYNERKQQIDMRTAGPYLGGFFCNGYQTSLHILTQHATYDDSKKKRIAILLCQAGADRDVRDYKNKKAGGNLNISEEEVRLVNSSLRI